MESILYGLLLLSTHKVEVDTLKPAELAELGIKSIPTIIISKDGKEASRFVGVQNKETLIEAIDSLQ